MNNRNFVFEVFNICEHAVVAGQGFAEAYTKVCTLARNESAPASTNSYSLTLPNGIIVNYGCLCEKDCKHKVCL